MQDNMIENATIYLLTNYNYYGQFLIRTKKIITKDPNICPTMGISIRPDGIYIYANEYFIEQFPVKHLAGILAHECEHGLRNHLDREKSLEGDLRSDKQTSESIIDRFKKNHKAYLLNLAEDIAINQDLPDLPQTFKIFDKDGKVLKDEKGDDVECKPASLENLKESIKDQSLEIRKKEAMEYYYGLLKNLPENENLLSSGGFTIVPLDSHEILAESMQEIDKDLAKKIIQQVANDSLKATKASGAGNVPGHIELLVDKLNRASVDWREELRQFRTNCSSSEKEPTTKKRNRRYGFTYPGYRFKDTTTLAVVLDSSGSTSEYWKQFFSEMKEMAETGANIIFIECDAEVQHVEALTSDFEPKIKGGGGTLFKPAFDLIDSEEFQNEYGKISGMIYMTDGDNFDAGDITEPQYRVAWVLPKGCNSRYTWGQRIEITLKDTEQ